MKKLLWIMTALLALIAGIVLSALVFVVDTEHGLQWVATQLVDNIPVKITYDSLHGRLADQVSIENLHYEIDNTTFSIEKLVIKLQLADLIHGSLHFKVIEGNVVKYIQRQDPSQRKQTNPQMGTAFVFPKLPISIKLDRSVFRDISIFIQDTQATDTQQPFLINKVSADSILLDQSLTIKELHAETVDYSISINGSIGMSSNFPFDLHTSWRADIPGYTNVTGIGTVAGDLQQIEFSQSTETPFKAQIHGKISDLLNTPQQEIQMTGEWQNFNWPSNASPTITSTQGDIQIEGNLKNYQFILTTSLENIPQFPPGKWSASGHGGLNELLFSRVEGKILDGNIHGQGKLSWQPQLAWQFKVNGREINPAKQWPDWPGIISFDTAIDGGLQDKGLFATVKLQKATGKIRDYPLAAQGQFDLTPDSMSVSNLKINSDNNTLHANGTLTDRWDFTWDLDASEINTLLPHVSGTILGKGKVIGPKKTPHLTMSAQGKQLSFDTNTATSVDVSADIDLLSTQPSIINLVASDIHVGQQSLDEFELQAVGMINDLELKATLKTLNTTILISTNAVLQNNQWSGVISTADVVSSQYGEWKLEKSFQYSVSTSNINIDKGCWQILPTQLCLEGHWQQDTGGQATVSANKFSLSLAQEFLPSGLDVNGTLDAQGNFDISAAGDTLGSVQLHTENGSFSQILASGTKIDVEYSDATATLRLAEHDISADAVLNINKDDFIKGSISLPQTTLNIITPTSFDNIPVQGQLNAKLNDLELLPYFIPEIENTDGTISIDLTLNGTTSQPRLKGLAQLENGSAEIPRAGLHLTNVQMSVSGNAIDKLKITSQAQSGKGTLAIDGTFGWDIEDRIKAQFAITGKQFEIVKIPEIWMTASPDLTIDIAHRRVDINGAIQIPEALIEPRDLASTRRPSSDVTIENGEVQDVQQRWQIYSLVNIIPGEQVKFDGFGLTGNIDGNVALIDAPNKITTAYGQLQINKGIYKAYGQKLAVEKGRLLFVGGPVDNPGLDISATRSVDNVTASVNIRGTLQSPRLHVFCAPAMSETDCFSYLVVGRPISQASQSEGEILFGAATSIGFAGGELVAKKIGSAFQIDEVHIDSGSKPEEATLVVGKYLSPKLYVSYGVGLIEPINTFIMRYKLGKRWSLQTESGLNSGADLFYTLER